MSEPAPGTGFSGRLGNVWLGLVAVGLLLAVVARGGGPLPGDLTLTYLVQRSFSGAGVSGTLLALAGEAVYILPVAAILVALVLRRWVAAVFVLLASLPVVFIGEALIKPLVARPRPPTSLMLGQEPPESYSFPSLTALLAFAVLGMVLYLIWQAQPAPRSPKWHVGFAVALLLLVATGVSRVYVGEHWPTDILGGWLFGGAWLILLILVHRRLFEKPTRR